MQKFMYEAAKTNFCSLEILGVSNTASGTTPSEINNHSFSSLSPRPICPGFFFSFILVTHWEHFLIQFFPSAEKLIQKSKVYVASIRFTFYVRG